MDSLHKMDSGGRSMQLEILEIELHKKAKGYIFLTICLRIFLKRISDGQSSLNEDEDSRVILQWPEEY